MKTFSLFFSLIVLWAAPASAQVHAGVALASIVPADTTVLEVRAPDEAGLPVRIRLAREGALAALLDVWVLPSEEAARALYEARSVTLASAPLATRALGDIARADVGAGPATLVLARRDNVVFSVRTLDAQTDAAALAAHVDAAIVHAPTGSVRPTVAPQSTSRDGVITLSEAPGIAAMSVRMTDSGSFERTEHGFVVRGACVATWVDAQLRTGSATY